LSLTGCVFPYETTNDISTEKFQKNRAAFKSNLINKGKSPQDYQNFAAKNGNVKLEFYQSGEYKLKALLEVMTINDRTKVPFTQILT